MKRILLGIAMISSAYLSAQTVIVNEKYEKKNEPVDFVYLPVSKKMVIFTGKQLPQNRNEIYNAYSYTSNGSKETLFEKEKIIDPVFSPDGNAFKAKDISSEGRGSLKYVNNKNNSFRVKLSHLNNTNNSYFGITDEDTRIFNVVNDNPAYYYSYRSYNNVYDLGFTNEKGSAKINFEEDDIYLEVYNVESNSSNRAKIEKPNLALLMGDSYTDFKGKTSFNCRIKGNDTFDLITKSLSKERNQTILYKATYDFSGKKISEVSFKLDLKEGIFSLSNNLGGGLKTIGSGINHTPIRTYLDVLSINNYYEDSSNGDIYIYGAFSLSNESSPCGNYVFKFDKNGVKIWESINKIDCGYKLDDYSYFNVSLLEYNNNLLLCFDKNYHIVDKVTGSFLKSDNVSYDYDAGYTRYISFINNTYVTEEKKDKSLKRKTFSSSCFIAMNLDNKFLDYIKSVSSEEKAIYFQTIFSNEGIWLLETDNKNYYKVLFFKE